MSAFIVADQTINNILYHVSKQNDLDNFTFQNKVKTIYGLSIKDSLSDLKSLGVMMIELNCRGVNARYNESDFCNFTYSPAPNNKCQGLKSLQCFTYQCCEGDIPETNKLYKLFEGLKKSYMCSIINNIEEYQEAAWD